MAGAWHCHRGRWLASVLRPQRSSPGIIGKAKVRPSTSRIAMPQNSKASVQAEKLRSRAIAVEAREAAKDVAQMLRQHPSLALEVLSFAEKCLLETSAGKSPSSSTKAPSSADPLTRKLGSKSVKNLPLCDLKAVLAGICQQTFSSWGLRRVLPREGRASEERKALLQLLEFTTKIAPEFRIDPALLPDLASLVRYSKEQAERCGNRAAQLETPIDWPRHGVYQLLPSADPDFAQIKHISEDRVIDFSLGAGCRPQDLHITNNFSDQTAKLEIAGSPQSFLLSTMFACAKRFRPAGDAPPALQGHCPWSARGKRAQKPMLTPPSKRAARSPPSLSQSSPSSCGELASRPSPCKSPAPAQSFVQVGDYGSKISEATFRPPMPSNQD